MRHTSLALDTFGSLKGLGKRFGTSDAFSSISSCRVHLQNSWLEIKRWLTMASSLLREKITIKFSTNAVEKMAWRGRNKNLVREASVAQQWSATETKKDEALDSENAAVLALLQGLAIRRRLAQIDPNNPQWKIDAVNILDQIGDTYLNEGMRCRAITAYEESLAIRCRLAEIEPRNPRWTLDVARCLNKLGDVKLDLRDSHGALAVYERSLVVQRSLLKINPNNTRWQFGIAETLEKIGDLRVAVGQENGALAAYEEMLAIDRELVAMDGSPAEWQLNLSLSLDRAGNVKLALGDLLAAAEAYEESLAIRRQLVELDQPDAHWAQYVAWSLEKIEDLRRVAAALDCDVAQAVDGCDIDMRVACATVS
jgi:tetratricopeptide (TPR) repeat protein